MALFPKVPSEDRQKEWFSVLVGIIPTTIGFFLGLLLNSFIENSNSQEDYRTMVKALNIETAANHDMLVKGFKRYYNTGFVLRELHTDLTHSYLNDINFIRHAPTERIELMTKYYLSAERVNAFRKVFLEIDKMKLTDDGNKLTPGLLDSQYRYWGMCIDTCIRDVDNIQKFKD